MALCLIVSCTLSAQVFNRKPLYGGEYALLPLGDVKPEGWLLEQLRRQADGATGHMDELYPEVLGDNNAWLGGDGDTWERGPYWIDGLLPLAYILDDEALKAKANKWVEAMLGSATPEGYFGNGTDHPYVEGLQRGKSHDWWPKIVAVKILQQYYEATQDQRVLEVLDGWFRYQLRTLPETPLGHWSDWAEWRASDNLSVIYWLYNISGEEYLLELAELIHSQAVDIPETIWSRKAFEEQNSIHCVNLAQSLKMPVVWWQQCGDVGERGAAELFLERYRKTIAFPTGLWAGDELVHFGDPVRGSELCTAVEMMFSLEEMFRITGDARWAELLERVAYNALPTQVSDDFMTHQYYQQINQIACTRQRRNFVTEHYGTDNVFGLLNGYPCCACNMHQGWPKFVRNLWYATPGGGLAAFVYAPCTVSHKVGDVTVTLKEETSYPFNGDVKVTVRFPAKAGLVSFPIQFRIPSWCAEATVTVKGRTHSVKGGSVFNLNAWWRDGDVIQLSFPMEITPTRWYDGSVCVERGPLLYALKMEEQWTRKEFTGADREQYGPYYYEVTSPSSWNYGFSLSDLDFSVAEVREASDVWPWNPEGAPVTLRAKAVVMEDWKEYNGSAGPIAYFTEDGDDTGDTAWIELIPYGCTTLRIAEFPARR